MATLDRTTIPFSDASNARLRKTGVYTGPASYATGGDSLTAQEVGLGQIHVLQLEAPTNGSVVVVARYDYTNAKVKWFDMAGAEITATTNLSAYTARFEAIGL